MLATCVSWFSQKTIDSCCLIYEFCTANRTEARFQSGNLRGSWTYKILWFPILSSAQPRYASPWRAFDYLLLPVVMKSPLSKDAAWSHSWGVWPCHSLRRWQFLLPWSLGFCSPVWMMSPSFCRYLFHWWIIMEYVDIQSQNPSITYLIFNWISIVAAHKIMAHRACPKYFSIWSETDIFRIGVSTIKPSKEKVSGM